MLEKNRDMFRFFQFMIALRKRVRALRTNLSDGYYGFPDVSFHGVAPWHSQFQDHERYVGVLFAGQAEGEAPQIVYAASNAYWKPLEVELPELPAHLCWEQLADTWQPEQSAQDVPGGRFSIGPRSVKVFAARPV